jgi:hypothetical protein
MADYPLSQNTKAILQAAKTQRQKDLAAKIAATNKTMVDASVAETNERKTAKGMTGDSTSALADTFHNTMQSAAADNMDYRKQAKDK